MSRGLLLTSAAASAMILGTGWYLARRGETRQAVRGSDARLIPIISPVIDLRIAEAVLEAMEHSHGERITVLLHTQGGCVASCVLISSALRQYPHSTAVVPYMAISGGTMIALNARRLEMGRNAALSAVDPIVSGMRARHLRVKDDDGGLGALARDYYTAIEGFLRETLAQRLPAASEDQLTRAVTVFMGEKAPHEWPVYRPEIEQLGINVESAAHEWASQVDAYRRRWW